MWSILNGTIVNGCTVAVGSVIGLTLSGRLPDRFQRIILDGLGLVTIVLGVDASVVVMTRTVEHYGSGIPTYGARLAMVVVATLLIGAILGTALCLHQRVENLGTLIHSTFGSKSDDPQAIPSYRCRLAD